MVCGLHLDSSPRCWTLLQTFHEGRSPEEPSDLQCTSFVLLWCFLHCSVKCPSFYRSRVRVWEEVNEGSKWPKLKTLKTIKVWDFFLTVIWSLTLLLNCDIEGWRYGDWLPSCTLSSSAPASFCTCTWLMRWPCLNLVCCETHFFRKFTRKKRTLWNTEPIWSLRWSLLSAAK